MDRRVQQDLRACPASWDLQDHRALQENPVSKVFRDHQETRDRKDRGVCKVSPASQDYKVLLDPQDPKENPETPVLADHPAHPDHKAHRDHLVEPVQLVYPAILDLKADKDQREIQETRDHLVDLV